MKKIVLFLTFLIAIINSSNAQIELNPNSAHRLNIKAVGSGDLWGVFGTTSTTNTNMVFRSGISNTTNWQNTGLITGTLGYDGTNNMGLKLSSFDRDLGLYGISKIRLGTNANLDRMVILNNGNVGINLNSPFGKFEVFQTGSVGSGWGGYLPSYYTGGGLRAAGFFNGTHSTLNDNYDAVGVAGHGNWSNFQDEDPEFGTGTSRNIGILGTAGNTANENIGIHGYVSDQTSSTQYKRFYGAKTSGFANTNGSVYGLYTIGENNGSGQSFGIYATTENIFEPNNYAGYFKGSVGITGFTQLGPFSPKIAVIKLTGTTQISQNAYKSITHGITLSKILNVEVVVSPSNTEKYYKKWTATTNYEFDYYLDSTYVHIYNVAGNSANILNKPFTVYITYEQ